MLDKNIHLKCLTLIALPLALICFVGCEVPQSGIDPNMLIAQEADMAAKPAPQPVQQVKPVQTTEHQRGQAVSMYVDAMMLNDLNEREKAIRKLNRALELDPKFALAYSLKGDILQGMEQYQDSANAYEQATIHDPWSFKDFLNLGKVCQIIKEWARAAKAYVSACKLDPQHYPAHLGAAQSYYEIKDYDSSLTYAEKAKTLDPNQPDPELLLGDLYEAKKDHQQAINAYRRALELEGNDPSIMISLARAYLRSGRYSSSKELLNDVISTDPENSMAHQYLGFAQLRLKETVEAIQSYQRAVELNENDWMARKGLGVAYMLMSMKQNDDRMQAMAVEQWNISLQIKPDQSKLRELVNRYQ
ncbi:MAG: tetratricopeptide repeat protein [Planctomycetota bacterium]|jgi:tetratricopeptide (TPR) repeat protein